MAEFDWRVKGVNRMKWSEKKNNLIRQKGSVRPITPN